ncbi:hypothetical protein M514_08554 [Trichuris suis]|uniref:Uncharacterized protein n=1 Tax=Trichuris suis TaxID=68888 RepID=A0A085M059_9BILA|nr:hypothetical protein M513_08554 [Trichuris suis]KFD67699.1 hypothetical protein M514_08554 [Trichuris suis]
MAQSCQTQQRARTTDQHPPHCTNLCRVMGGFIESAVPFDKHPMATNGSTGSSATYSVTSKGRPATVAHTR